MPITFYEASAGSGKTTELVNFYLSICFAENDDTYFKHILAMTFTVKAAQEMKERVLSVLKKVAKGEENEILQKLFLDTNHRLVEKGEEMMSKSDFQKKAQSIRTKILHRYSDFSILTIDSFFNRIVNAFAFDLRIPMDFSIYMNQKELLQKAIDILLEGLGTNISLTNFVLNFSNQEFENEKNGDIEKKLFELERLIFSEKNIGFINQLKNKDLEYYNDLKNQIKVKKINYQKQLQTYANNFVRFLEFHSIEIDCFSYNTIQKFILKIQNTGVVELGKTLEKQMNGEANFYTNTFKNKNPEAANHIDAMSEEIILELHKIFDFDDEQKEKLLPWFKINEQIEKLALLTDLIHHIDDIKKESSSLTFQDINQIIEKEISKQHAPFIYERVGVKYHHFLIDEFQDTSVMQFYNILPLLLESNDEYDNLIVGDAKQAIYRFRNGEVELIRNLPDLIPEIKNLLPNFFENKLKFQFKKIELDKNFRSKSTIIEFNNLFFNRIFAEFPFHMQASDIYRTVNQKIPNPSAIGYVEIYNLQKETTKNNTISETIEENTDEEEETVEFSVQQTDWIIEKIERSLEHGFAYKDMAILVRRNKQIRDIAHALIEKNIPFVSSESLSLSSDPTINFIVDVFQVLVHPKNSISMLNILQFIDKNEFVNEDGQFLNLEKFKNILSKWYFKWKDENFYKKNVLEIFYEILSIFKIELHGIFINTLHDILLENASKWFHALDFLNWWESESHKVYINLPEHHDAVKIMTYHKAKGLEFDVVICPIENGRLMHEDIFIDWEDEKYLLKNTKDTDEIFGQNWFRTYVENENLDILNNLYVAFTRAKDRLYILNILKSKPKDEKPDAEDDSENESPVELIKISNIIDEFTKKIGSNIFGNELPKNIEIKKQKETVQEIENTIAKKDFLQYAWKKHLQPRYTKSAAATNYGNTFHKYASQINSLDDFEIIYSQILKNNLLDENIQHKLINELKKLESDSMFRSLLEKKLEVLSERKIYIQNDQNIRPDKLILHENALSILDFKTGLPNEKYQVQILDYKKELEKLGYQNISTYIVYSDPFQIVTS